jgi:hypothetical protein
MMTVIPQTLHRTTTDKSKQLNRQDAEESRTAGFKPKAFAFLCGLAALRENY